MAKGSKPLPPDWNEMLKRIGATVAEALELNECREQACAAAADLVNWEIWEKAGARLAERVQQLPASCEPMNEIDEELAATEQALRGYVRDVEQLSERLDEWTAVAVR